MLARPEMDDVFPSVAAETTEAVVEEQIVRELKLFCRLGIKRRGE